MVDSTLWVEQDGHKLPRELYLTGQACAGKGHVEAILQRCHGYVPVAYSDALYERVAHQAGVTVEQVKANKMDYRSALQTLGHGMRQDNPNYWVDIRNERVGDMGILLASESGGRYVNEQRQAMQRGLVLQVRSRFTARMQRSLEAYGTIPTQEQLDHPTEALADFLPCHDVISNTRLSDEALHRCFLLRAEDWVTAPAAVWERDERLRVTKVVLALISAYVRKNHEFEREVEFNEANDWDEWYRNAFILQWPAGNANVARPATLFGNPRLLEQFKSFINDGHDSVLLAILVEAQRMGFRSKFTPGLIEMLKEACAFGGYPQSREFLG